MGGKRKARSSVSGAPVSGFPHEAILGSVLQSLLCTFPAFHAGNSAFLVSSVGGAVSTTAQVPSPGPREMGLVFPKGIKLTIAFCCRTLTGWRYLFDLIRLTI